MARRAQLENQSRLLKHQLDEQLRSDSAGFARLADRLVADEGYPPARLPASAERLKSIVCAARESLQTSRSILHNGLHCRAQIIQARDILELLLDISYRLSRVDGLLLPLRRMKTLLEQCNGEIVNLDHNDFLLLERIAGELNCLNPLIARVDRNFITSGRPLFLENMAARIQGARRSLDTCLCGFFEMALKQKNEEVAVSCLRAFTALDSIPCACDVIRRSIAVPMMKSVFSQPDYRIGDAALLQRDLDETRKLAENECKFLKNITSKLGNGNEGADSIHVICGSFIIQELHGAIHRKKPLAFSPGNPSIFVANYKASLESLDFIEAQYCSSKSEIAVFRSQRGYLHFMKEWDVRLGVYFTIRVQEIGGEMEDALTKAGSLDNAAHEHHSDDHLALAPSKALVKILFKCWDEDGYVPSLTPKLLALTLQLLSRYERWLSATMQETTFHGSSLAPLVKNDVELVVSMLKGDLLEGILALLKSSPLTARALVCDSLHEAANTLKKVVSAC